jgi:signal transduction histidine kinase
VSLASSSIDALEQADQSAAAREDAIRAIQTIERRGEGLMRFVNTYRSLTKIPKPRFSSVPVESLFQDVSLLFRERLKGTAIEFEVINEVTGASLMADPDLMQQVILNLLLNAADALEGISNPKIILRGQIGSDSRLTIEVEDNGKGILAEILDDIFIPFFTTKRTGSGIGLSLTRQILTLHGATIRANSQPGNKTVFIIRF